MKAEERDFDQAVDWLMNSRHTADPDIQDTFWAISDGQITRDEADTLDMPEIRRRRSAGGSECEGPTRG